MSITDDQNTTTNVINFGRRTGRTGFNLTPTPPTDDTVTLGPVIPPQPTTDPETGTLATRRSPLDILNALPSPTLTAPVVTTASPDGGLPDTFRSDHDDDQAGPQIGALSMAAILAVAIAALRGTHTFLEDRRQRRMAREAEEAPLREARLKHQLAMAQHGYSAEEAAAKGQTDLQKARDKAARKNRVPSGAEYGRKTLNRSGSGGGSGSSGGGSSKKSSTRTPNGGGAGTAGSGRGPDAGST